MFVKETGDNDTTERRTPRLYHGSTVVTVTALLGLFPTKDGEKSGLVFVEILSFNLQKRRTTPDQSFSSHLTSDPDISTTPGPVQRF